MNPRTPSQRFSPPMVGGSSLLVIFAVLCLTIFTLLALGTVQADTRLSEASIQAVTDYYAADQQAEEILARLRSGETVAGVLCQDHIYTYSCPISDTQVLEVAVQHQQGQWIVLRWQAISTVTY